MGTRSASFFGVKDTLVEIELPVEKLGDNPVALSEERDCVTPLSRLPALRGRPLIHGDRN